ncbi:uroporphyrinogen-III synthase [Halalkalibacter hemicellulosilyticus]|uniref:Uroporphyrinogen-III synthase n=1 Tax=Halalkalibacter hemicellulosilyticusJCM 9152 TaxID=1236971 RepID=W4QE21_9BACI|nr:uroporphyrinogen-III synthase [Halalkalibacter hemicellulosilyticus]GAE30202.1 uroporphyrinogen-III methyltransferase [Halalkalibacter hemicellulosilyticusJCM 9152]
MSERPLRGQRIIVTRAEGQSQSLVEQIENAGGISIELPLIAFRAINHGELKKAISQLNEVEWLIFTSANGVHYTIHAYEEQIKELREHFNIAVVGEKTEDALQAYGLKADLLPSEYVAESLLHALKDKLKPNDKVLVTRGQLGRAILLEGLADLGVDVREIIVYETYCPVNAEDVERALQRSPTILTFTSSSTVRHFSQLCQERHIDLSNISSKIACIGPIAKQTALMEGLKVDIMPTNYTIEALVEAIITHVKEEKNNGFII